MLPRPCLKVLALLACLVPAAPALVSAQDVSPLAENLSPRVLFVTSGGFWQETLPAETSDGAETGDTEKAGELDAAAVATRGYYRLIALRGPDNRSELYLQQVALGAEGPEVAMTLGIEEINALGAYITDIRPENSTGAASGPGFAAYVYLKTDPTVIEPETWSVYLDEFGDLRVEPSSN